MMPVEHSGQIQDEWTAAFPTNTTNKERGGACLADPGMSLRDYFAGQVLSNSTSGALIGFTPDDCRAWASRAYGVADAMLAERTKK